MRSQAPLTQQFYGKGLFCVRSRQIPLGRSHARVCIFEGLEQKRAFDSDAFAACWHDSITILQVRLRVRKYAMSSRRNFADRMHSVHTKSMYTIVMCAKNQVNTGWNVTSSSSLLQFPNHIRLVLLVGCTSYIMLDRKSSHIQFICTWNDGLEWGQCISVRPFWPKYCICFLATTI